jgi:Zn-dependent protease with chaperone function
MKHDFVKHRRPFSALTTFIFFTIILSQPLFFIWLALFNRTTKASEFLNLFFYMLFAVLLTLWSFLREPVVIIARYKLESLSNTRPEIVEQVLALATAINLKRTPIILRIPNNQDMLIFTFGTWRHQYIAISDQALAVWSDQQTLEAVVLHELGHLASGDIWKTGWSLQYIKWLGVFAVAILSSSVFGTVLVFSIGDVLRSLGLVITALAIFLAVRFLFRTRELVADEFASNFSDDIYLKKVILAKEKTSEMGNHSAFEGLYNNGLNKLLGFHPDKKSRLMVMQGQGENIFAQEIPGLLFVAGLLIGEFTSFYSDISLVYKIIIGGVLFFAPFFLSLSLTSSRLETTGGRAFLLLESISKLITGVALAFIVQVLPNTFFETSPVDGKSLLIHSPLGMYHYLGLFWDTLLVLMLILPVILFLVIWVSEVVTAFGFKSLGIHRPMIVPWLIQAPLFIFLHWEWQSWSMGDSFSFKAPLFFMIFWTLWIIIFYAFFKSRSLKKSTVTV